MDTKQAKVPVGGQLGRALRDVKSLPVVADSQKNVVGSKGKSDFSCSCSSVADNVRQRFLGNSIEGKLDFWGEATYLSLSGGAHAQCVSFCYFPA